MTKKDFICAAELVKAIQDGKWTDEIPSWGLGYRLRPVQTAEVFIKLFAEDNPRFDQSRFLYACGLGPQPVMTRKTVCGHRLHFGKS